MLNKMAYLLGGVVAGGFLGEDEARTELRNAISQREIGDEKGAFQTIDDGLAAGLLKPVLPDALQYAARQQLRHGGTVATVALGISASQGLPADIITPAVQAIADEIARPAVVLETFWDVSDPGQDKPLADNTHHNAYGGYELARCVVEEVRAKVPALAAHLAADAGRFDPARPDPPGAVDIPASPATGPSARPKGD